MIRSVRLRNYKCFEDVAVPCAPLTLLAGINGAGKSSLIQALLLLRQSWDQKLLGRGLLALNGDLAQVGTAKDALYGYSEEDRFGFDVEFAEGERSEFEFIYDRGADVLTASKTGAAAGESIAKRLERESLFGAAFYYLAAERVGPRVSSPTAEFLVRHNRQIGTRGEYAVQFLSIFGTQPVARGLLKENAAAPDLLSQTEAWLNVISPGTRLKVSTHAEMDLVQLQYQHVSGADVSDPYRPTNVGFGLSYTLPVLVAVLASGPGALVIIENPEAHLHPKGQMLMGRFLAQAAASGVQVFIETHSDHVLNGIRVAVHDGELNPADAALHWFRHPTVPGTMSHEVVPLRIDRDGRIDRWPEGFFDQWDVALDKLLQPAPER